VSGLLNLTSLDGKSKTSQHLTNQPWSFWSMCGWFSNPLKQYHNFTNTDQYVDDSHVEFFSAFEHSLEVLKRASLYGTIHA
jgi:hypothetical protein